MPDITSTIFTCVAFLAATAAFGQDPNHLLRTNCIACHNEYTLQAGLNLTGFDAEQPISDLAVAEKIIRKLRAGQMPPREMTRNQAEIDRLAATLEQALDRHAAQHNWAGTRPFQRVNRAEYARLIQDLLGLTIDPAEWLPEDRISASFDNIADAQEMSATLMIAYLTAASDIARRAVGNEDAPPVAMTYSNPPGLSQHQWERVEGAPYGTRGGISALHTFPADGEYTFAMRFMSGWGERYDDIDVSVNRERVALVRYGGDIDYQGLKDFPVETEPVFVKAGQHRVTAAFIRKMDGPYEDLLKPNLRSLTGTETSYGTTSPPNLMHLTIEGPYNVLGVSETRSRQQIFSCRPTGPDEELPCAEEIVARLASQAFGESIDAVQLQELMRFYSLGREEGGFELGIRAALEATLASPRFLFRVEREPKGVKPGDSYRLAGVDLANRLSFFLWGTNPDSELLALAESGRLTRTRTLRAQAERLLAAPESEALATRFASLWLRLQDLGNVEPDEYWYPHYTRQLSDAMRRETEIFFDHLVKADRPMLELYSADYSFMNERLARHYGIEDVDGARFRKVMYPDDQRRGILGHGSILTQTSLGNRTSPVLRGKWVVEVLLGTSPPPPPPGIPDLEETAEGNDGETLTTRKRLEMHSANPTCAACHKVMDPIGLALDNFDVTGQWRIRENDVPLDTRAIFYDGTPIQTPAELSAALLKRPVPLVREFTANLMAYALGRRVEPLDMPTVRQIVSDAGSEDYRMSELIIGVIMSDQFRMKDAVISPTQSMPDVTTD
ncbi:MAG: DUF1592 domain-containing protein [Woeseiaceae bacterium]|nr:DUF1592 domain-containing protein [Woeseiaceae bacterium]